jgi:hypothetical protein
VLTTGDKSLINRQVGAQPVVGEAIDRSCAVWYILVFSATPYRLEGEGEVSLEN